ARSGNGAHPSDVTRIPADSCVDLIDDPPCRDGRLGDQLRTAGNRTCTRDSCNDSPAIHPSTPSALSWQWLRGAHESSRSSRTQPRRRDRVGGGFTLRHLPACDGTESAHYSRQVRPTRATHST